MADKPLPYVTAALFCERVLQEKDDTLSAMRVADKLTVQFPLGLPEGIKPAIPVIFFLSLKSGPVVGQQSVTIRAIKPSGGPAKDVQTLPFNFLGQDQGQNYIVNVMLGVEEPGLYWFEVVFDEQVLTRTPLLIVQQQLPETLTQTPKPEPEASEHQNS
jgi:hypothetical protein